MSLILNIDSSSEKASICVARDGLCISKLENTDQKDHASWMHEAILTAMNDAGLDLHKLEAIAVSAGPGSYTGLRISMSTAKGLSYALNIPLITENTLRVMALASKQALKEPSPSNNILFCPMIDARRMEVFTALFNAGLEEILKSTALELTSHNFSTYLEKYEIIFSGNGSKKFKTLIEHEQAIFSDNDFSVTHLAQLSHKKFLNGDFSDVLYAEPLYLKEFYTPSKK